MGNQKSSQGKISSTNNQRTSNEHLSRIDFDGLIEESIWTIWLKIRPKSSANFKREDLIINIDWNNVLIEEDPIEFNNSTTIHYPQSQTLFRTKFENSTNDEHIYTLRTDRTSFSTLKFRLTNALKKSNGSNVDFRLPVSISGISPDQQISFQCDTTKEYEIHWPIDSQIRLSARTRTSVEMFIDEEEFQSDFRLPIRFSGEIKATIVHRQSTEIALKTFRIDLVQLVRETMKCRETELHVDRCSSYVRFELRGQCSFRYGIKENLHLQQHSVDSSISSTDLHYSPSAPTDYCRLTSLNLQPNSWPMSQMK